MNVEVPKPPVTGAVSERPRTKDSDLDHDSESSTDTSMPSQKGRQPRNEVTTMLVSQEDADRSLRKPSKALERLRDQTRASSTAALKARLSLDDGNCGALTLKDMACRRSIPAQNIGAIDSSLQKLSAMTQSSEELDRELEDLVRLVHCSLHRYGRSSEIRVCSWIEALPKGNDAQKSPVVLAREVKKALGPISPTCAGRTKAGAPCRKRIGGQKVQNCRRSIAELVNVDDLPDGALWELFLSILEANRYCDMHILQQSTQNVRRWLNDLVPIHKAAQPSRPASSGFVYPANAALTLARSRSGLQDKIDVVLQARQPSGTNARPNSLPWPSDKLLGFWPLEPDITPLRVVSRGDSEMYHDRLKPNLRDTIRAPLELEDQKSGYVYAYEVEGSFGMVKIGYTTRTIEVRHQEWIHDCNRKTILLYPARLDGVGNVPNARRIEALCHAELREYRRTIYCDACIRQHNEWFEVAGDEAARVIQKWTLWMNTKRC